MTSKAQAAKGAAASKTAPKPVAAQAPEAPSADASVSPPAPAADAAQVVRTAADWRAATTAEALMFNYAFNHGAPKDRHLASFMKIFGGVIELGHAAWPLELKSLVWGKDVLDFGCGSTLYGPALRALGARSYAGIDRAIDPTRKRYRSRALKQTVSLDFSPADVARIIPNVTYMQADDVISREAFDVVLMQSVSHALEDVEKVIRNIHRSLRPGGEIWMLHDNFYAWAGHQQAPKSPAAYNPEDPAQQAMVDWGHVLFDPPEGHPFRTHLNRVRLRELRSILDRYFEVDGWKEIPDRASIAPRLTPEVRARLKGFQDSELLAKQVIIRGRRR